MSRETQVTCDLCGRQRPAPARVPRGGSGFPEGWDQRESPPEYIGRWDLCVKCRERYKAADADAKAAAKAEWDRHIAAARAAGKARTDEAARTLERQRAADGL